MTETGLVVAATEHTAGSELDSDHAAGSTVLNLMHAVDFPDDGGQLAIDAVVYDYVTADDDTVTLALPTLTALAEGTRVIVYPPVREVIADVQVGGEDDTLPAVVPHSLLAFLAEGERSGDDREAVEVAEVGTRWVVTDVVGRDPRVARDVQVTGRFVVLDDDGNEIVVFSGATGKLILDGDKLITRGDVTFDAEDQPEVSLRARNTLDARVPLVLDADSIIVNSGPGASGRAGINGDALFFRNADGTARTAGTIRVTSLDVDVTGGLLRFRDNPGMPASFGQLVAGTGNIGLTWSPNGGNPDELRVTTADGSAYRNITAAAFPTSSDLAQKEHVAAVPDGALEQVLAVKVVDFDRIDTPGRFRGVVAQQVADAVPSAYVAGEPGHAAVDPMALLGTAYKAIQELTARVRQLEGLPRDA